jgi:hypothetical protein
VQLTRLREAAAAGKTLRYDIWGQKQHVTQQTVTYGYGIGRERERGGKGDDSSRAPFRSRLPPFR